MRQSYLDPKVWVSLDPNDATTPAASAGVESSSDFDGLEILP
jgi:hypothetical protein